jgi:hypothetical protein
MGVAHGSAHRRDERESTAARLIEWAGRMPMPRMRVHTSAAHTRLAASVARILMKSLNRHSGESRNPAPACDWIPAFAGMTEKGMRGEHCEKAPRTKRQWLLHPLWPLDDPRPALANIPRTVAHRKLQLGKRLQAFRRSAKASDLGLASAFALGAIVVFALVLLRVQVPHVGPRVMAVQPPATTIGKAPTQKSAAIATSMPASAMPDVTVTTAPADHAASNEANQRLLSDASTMDLMMPIAEPDLDIGSSDSLWSQVGKAYGVDPLLLYSVALVESKALYPDGKVAPTPWLFRVNDHLVRGDRHDVQLAMAAASQFGSAVQDVGIMQVYYPMHRDAVRDPLTLLNPRTNITVAAKILRDGMHQTHDRVLGVGYYHSHTPSLARDYGTVVMTVYQRLQAMHHATARVRLQRGVSARI